MSLGVRVPVRKAFFVTVLLRHSIDENRDLAPDEAVLLTRPYFLPLISSLR